MLRVICRLKDGNRTVGVRVIEELTGELREWTMDDASEMIHKETSSSTYVTRGGIQCKDGDSGELPIQEISTGKITGKLLIILGVLSNDTDIRNNKVYMGKTEFLVVDAFGNRKNLKLSQVVHLIEEVGCYNAKIIKYKDIMGDMRNADFRERLDRVANAMMGYREDTKLITPIKGDFNRFKIDRNGIQQVTWGNHK